MVKSLTEITDLKKGTTAVAALKIKIHFSTPVLRKTISTNKQNLSSEIMHIMTLS